MDVLNTGGSVLQGGASAWVMEGTKERTGDLRRCTACESSMIHLEEECHMALC